MNKLALMLIMAFSILAYSGCSDDPVTPAPDPENQTIHFDKNNASATGTMADVSAASGETIALSLNEFEYPSWGFTGWNTEPAGGGTQYSDGQEYTMTDSDITFYAQWEDVYVVREVGPAGGLVFYDKGSYSDGWRYIEASPEDMTATTWGTWALDLVGAAGTGFGDGRQNTLDIINEDPMTGTAAHNCAGYLIVRNNISYNEWFLPSIDELTAMYENLHLHGVGGFSTDPATTNYFSSSEFSNIWAWRHNFSTGLQYESGVKTYDMSVRAVRYF